MAKQNGRPPKMTEEKIKQLVAILRIKPTLADCAAFLDVEASTIDKWIKRTHGITFSEFREQKMVHTRFNLIRRALKMADDGNVVMLIFCLKNLCGWVDKVEQSVSDKLQETLKLKYSVNNEVKNQEAK